MTAKTATCARRNQKNAGNCLCSLRRHKITATTDCRIGCVHHKERRTLWLCKVMDIRGVARIAEALRRHSSHPHPQAGYPPGSTYLGNLSNHYLLAIGPSKGKQNSIFHASATIRCVISKDLRDR